VTDSSFCGSPKTSRLKTSGALLLPPRSDAERPVYARAAAMRALSCLGAKYGTRKDATRETLGKGPGCDWFVPPLAAKSAAAAKSATAPARAHRITRGPGLRTGIVLLLSP
jgi:hypothetical protein